MNDTRTRRRAGAAAMAALAVVGSLLTVGGILLLTVPFHDGTIPQWNALCSSDVGQIGQIIDNSAQHDCGMVSVADHLMGWLLGLGIVALAGSGGAGAGRVTAGAARSTGRGARGQAIFRAPGPGSGVISRADATG